MTNTGLELEKLLSNINENAIKMKNDAISTMNTTLITLVIIALIFFVVFSLLLSNQLITSKKDY
jgi:methyl-accepting chemotaxis protein